MFQGNGPGHPRQVPGAARGEVRQARRQEEREVPGEQADEQDIQQQAPEEGGGQETGLLHRAPVGRVASPVPMFIVSYHIASNISSSPYVTSDLQICDQMFCHFANY